jgi:molecular chaperone GrpE
VAQESKNDSTINQFDTGTQGDQGAGEEGATTSRAEETLASLKEEIVKKSDEAQALQDKYLRLAAEFENFKRLTQKEQRDFNRFANESLLKATLPIVDNLERAIKAAQGSSNGLIQGVELTLKQFLEVLGKFGVQPVDTIGKPFDPSCHQAVASAESTTLPNNHVLEEHQKGYRLHERILRAAMVTVSVNPMVAAEKATASSPGEGRES